MLGDRAKSFICVIPYQVPLYHGRLHRDQIEREMSESTFSQMAFDMEMRCIPYRDTEGSFFEHETIAGCRVLLNPMYEPTTGRNKITVPDLANGERRILSVDVALMASGKTHNNDAASIMINRAIPINANNYQGNLVYLEAVEGSTTDKLALKIKRLFTKYKCTDIALDTMGSNAHSDGDIRQATRKKSGTLRCESEWKALCNSKATRNAYSLNLLCRI